MKIMMKNVKRKEFNTKIATAFLKYTSKII